MNRLDALLVRLLRFLSSIVGASIKRLLALFNFIRRRTSITKKSKPTIHDDPRLPPPKSIYLRPENDIVYPSVAPRGGHVTLDIPEDHDHHDGPFTPNIYSPASVTGSFVGSHASNSSRHLATEYGSDSHSVNSRRSVAHQPNPAGASAISLLPISTHGLQIISARPESRNSQLSFFQRSLRPASSINSSRAGSAPPIKVSRAPTPSRPPTPLPHTADPSGDVPSGSLSRSSSPENARLILPMSTFTVKRWNRNIVVSTEYNFCIVDPFKLAYEDEELPAGWAPFTHPEGALYFFHKEKRIYTDADMYDPKQFAIISETGDQLLDHLRQEASNQEAATALPTEYDLVMELVMVKRDECEEQAVGYYFADHQSKLLFWLDKFDAEDICKEIKVVVSISHLRYEIESQYWTHYELYPNSRGFTQDLLDEVGGILLHATADTITSRTSTALWTTKQNKNMIYIVNHLKVNSKADNSWAGCVVGRLMRNLRHTQFVHLYGQRGARLNRDQSLHGTVVHPHSWHLKILGPILFWGAEVHLEALEKIWVDRTVHIEPWKHFIDKLNTEWQDFIIVATVLLNANVAFLAIQSVDNDGNQVVDRSPAQIVSYISIITSLGSVLLSMLLVRQNRSKGREAADKAAHFLANMTHSTRGLEHLAILYALPYALLMWSTLTFLTAFAIDCFSFASAATRGSVGSVLAVCSILVMWCIIAAWICESNDPHIIEEFKQRLRKRVRHTVNKLLRMDADAPKEKEKGGEGEQEEQRDPGEPAQAVISESPAATAKKSRKRSLSWQFLVRGATVDRSSDPEIPMMEQA